MGTFLVVGEALVDVVTDAAGVTVARPGGSPANVAVGLGRLGHQVTLLTALGDDERGREVQAHVEASHVRVVAAPLARTAVAHAQLDEHKAATYSFDIQWDLSSAADPGPADWLHLGSIGATLEPGGTQVLELARRFEGIVSYDPNCRPLLMIEPRVRVEELVAVCDVVKLSDEDCAWLFPGETEESVAQRWLALGPSLVVVTRGSSGAQAWTRTGALWVDAAAGGPVVDTVGAGDAFMAGLLAALVDSDLEALGPEDLQAALVRASSVARRTCERVGADPPWAAQL
ncbi:MAG: carbohydrate kinase [Frankiales bacterium]|nr:carbohydrate kinase [Frankiales bacterium]